MLNFDQKAPFLRKSQKTCFSPLFVQNKLKIDKNYKVLILNCFVDFKHLIRCRVFSFLQFFLNYMPNKVKILKIW